MIVCQKFFVHLQFKIINYNYNFDSKICQIRKKLKPL